MCLNCWRDICNFKSVLLTPSWWAWHQQLCFPSGAFRGFCIRSGDLCCCHGNCSQHGEGEGAVKEQKEPWGRGLSKLWTHTVCFVVNEWMKMRLFVPVKQSPFLPQREALEQGCTRSVPPRAGCWTRWSSPWSSSECHLPAEKGLSVVSGSLRP